MAVDLAPHSFCLLQGQATDIQIQAEEILKQKRVINQLYEKHTNQPLEFVGKLFMMN